METYQCSKTYAKSTDSKSYIQVNNMGSLKISKISSNFNYIEKQYLGIVVFLIILSFISEIGG